VSSISVGGMLVTFWQVHLTSCFQRNNALNINDNSFIIKSLFLDQILPEKEGSVIMSSGITQGEIFQEVIPTIRLKNTSKFREPLNCMV
jgi:hypothetical protein